MQHGPQASMKVTERTEPGYLTFFNLQVVLQKSYELYFFPYCFEKKGGEGGEGSTCIFSRRMLFDCVPQVAFAEEHHF